jgi:8-oxo-dGTP pyrophosphatase MutT (NUDIX family)
LIFLKKASVAAILRWKEKEKQNLEILFIRRTINERDTWSGQIAFPGGKRNTNENTLETAQRETMEEIGLDLKHPYVFDHIYLSIYVCIDR